MKNSNMLLSPITQKALGLIHGLAPELKTYLWDLSLKRIQGTPQDFTEKDVGEPRSNVTAADLMVHEALVETFKDDPVTIIAEEGCVIKEGAPYRVVLDDLDGTYNASRGVIGRSAISLAIDKDRKPIAGIWYNPYFDEMIVAEVGRGAWYICDGKTIRISPPATPTDLRRARIGIGTTGTTNDPRSKIFNPPLSELASRTLSWLNIECTAVSLMDVALGRTEGWAIGGNKAWDLWAARAIFSELSIPFAFFNEVWRRRLTDEEIANFDPDNHLFAFVCAANQKLFDKIVEILTK